MSLLWYGFSWLMSSDLFSVVVFVAVVASVAFVMAV
jgi:hypothetical protein